MKQKSVDRYSLLETPLDSFQKGQLVERFEQLIPVVDGKDGIVCYALPSAAQRVRDSLEKAVSIND